MDLQAWGQADSDEGRRGRLAIGYGAGVLVCAAAFGLLSAASSGVAKAEEEALLEVTLTEAIPAEEPKAPEPPPPPAVEEAPPPPAEPLKRALVAPVEIPTEAPPEADPDTAPPKATEDGPDAYDPNGSVNGVVGGTGLAPPKIEEPAIALPPPPPPPPPRPKGPVQLPENASAPAPVSTPQPSYPEAARTASIEATVVVKYVVTEAGAVSNVVIVRGHPAFDSVVLAAVRTWRFSPAMLDGKPIPVYRTARFPFKIKT